jgi:hypothetical protein
MPELPTLPAYLRRATLLLIGALSLHSLPARASAQTLPAGLRACTAEPDPSHRLACYDREMARLSTPSARPTAVRAPAKSDAPSRPAPVLAARTAVPTSPTPTEGNRAGSAPSRPSPWKFLAGGASSRRVAHVIRVERSPDAMILHLDNGEVWQQTGRASGDLSLRVGDRVTIEKHLGSYWLSSRYVSGMQVRLEPH